MKKHLNLLTGLVISCLSLAVHAKTTLIKNVNGYSLNKQELVKFSAIKITDDKISKIYPTAQNIEVEKSWEVVDGKGATMLPGLIDAHGHVLSYGQSLMNADLVGTTSEQQAIEKVIAFSKANASLTWVQGRGWNQVQWPSKQFPNTELLDKYFPDTPVWLKRVDGHAGWANSAAMALAGVTDNTVAPEGGEIIRDKQGKATGIFIDNAMALIDSKIAPLTLEQQKDILVKAMKSLASVGLTSVHDAGIDSLNLTAFKALAEENKMPIRINAMLYLPSDGWQEALAQGQFSSSDGMLSFNSVKIQADGALGSRGAALIEDYSDHSGHKGLLLHDKASLENYVNTAMSAGFQVNTHAIGDNANKITLDLYQREIAKTKTQLLRHRIEHAQVLRLEDIPRFEELGIIASMQATHATSDKNMAQDRLGSERILGAYAWRKLLNANAVIAAGSDFPVESPNPFYGLHASITRQDKSNMPDNGWFPDEKMTRQEALYTFTEAAAYSGHQEQMIGSINVGKKADFILINTDFFNAPESQLWKTKVLSTWVNGKEVFNLRNQ